MSSIVPRSVGGGKTVAVAFGGACSQPHVPWFVLPSSYAPANPNPPSAPYTAPGINTQAGNNPSPLGFDHPNVTRHWPRSNSHQPATPGYVVVIPSNVPLSPTGLGPDLTQTIASSFPGLAVNGAAANYTWKDWVNFVITSFAKYTNVQTAYIASRFDGAVYSTNNSPNPGGYGRSESAASGTVNFTQSLFAWLSSPGLDGPTGNGVNEIILTDQLFLGYGLTSMLLDPVTGEITECDVLLDVGVTTASNAAGPRGLFQQFGAAPTTTLPHEWTALEHELGHFFGLDHTNLYPGVPAPSIPLGVPLPIATYQMPIATYASRASYPVALPTTGGPTSIPSMCGYITHLGPGSNRINDTIHPDEATGLSIIYPVPMPQKGSSKLPLRNTTASYRGRITLGAGGSFGTNVWALPTLLLDVPGLGFPTAGTVSGTARLSDDPLLALTDPTNPSLLFYRNDLLPSTPGFIRNVSITGNQQGTGDFSIDGVPANATIAQDPPEYDIVFEDAISLLPLGLQTGRGEWFGANAGFYFGNLPTPPLGLMVGSAITSLYNTLAAVPPQASSLSVVAGSVIYLTPSETSDQSLLAIPPTILPNNPTRPTTMNPNSLRSYERVVRPIVSITPRDGRFRSSNLVITVRTDEALSAFDLNTARLFINGVDSTALLPAPVIVAPITSPPAPPNIVPGPLPAGGTSTATYTVPMATIVGTIPTTAPIELSFLIRAGINPTSGIAGSSDQYGNQVVTGVGRNDVVL